MEAEARLSEEGTARRLFMDTPLVHAALQVGLGGVLVFLAGIITGSA